MGWICWIFCAFFNAQRKHGGKFQYLDRCCDYFSSFVKIRDYITRGRKGKMILMAPFLFFVPFSSLFFLPPSWDSTQCWDLPYEHGSGFPLGGSNSLWGRSGGKGGQLSTLPGLWCRGSAALLPRAGDKYGPTSSPSWASLKPHLTCRSPLLNPPLQAW